MEVTVTLPSLQGLGWGSEQGSYARQWCPGLLAPCAHIMGTAQENTETMRIRSLPCLTLWPEGQVNESTHGQSVPDRAATHWDPAKEE